MCLFPSYPIRKKKEKNDIVYECGACPECLAKKSNRWALRAGMEAKKSRAIMVTLTYDEFEHDKDGKVIGEKNKDYNSMGLYKEHVQKFIKRVREYCIAEERKKFHAKVTQELGRLADKCDFKSKNARRLYIACLRKAFAYEIEEAKKSLIKRRQIKYICGAERGKKTNRPHYHVIMFNVNFPDCRPYKKSKRGNMIYMSSSLNKLWKYGICTVDSINAGVVSARYCTKYCAKDTRGARDTFMLFSQGIGKQAMLEEFNGFSYWLSGREYAIPRIIWQEVIYKRYAHRYKNIKQPFDFKYVNKSKNYEPFHYTHNFNGFAGNVAFCLNEDKEYLRASKARKNFRTCRDKDKQYIAYLAYWQKKIDLFNFIQPSVETRINMLPNDKYFSYKQYALACLARRKKAFERGFVDYFVNPPRANCVKRAGRDAYLFDKYLTNEEILQDNKITCRIPSRHYTASDSKQRKYFGKICKLTSKISCYPVFTQCPFDKKEKIIEKIQKNPIFLRLALDKFNYV